MCGCRRLAGISFFHESANATTGMGHAIDVWCERELSKRKHSSANSICCITRNNSVKILNCHLRLHSTCVFMERILLSTTWVRAEQTHIVPMFYWLAKMVLAWLRCENYEWVGTKSVMSEWSHRHECNYILYCMSDRSTIGIIVNNICWNYCVASDERLLIRSPRVAVSGGWEEPGDANASINVIFISAATRSRHSQISNLWLLFVSRWFYHFVNNTYFQK